MPGTRLEVMHGVNFDQLDRRDPGQYGGMSLDELERKIEGYAHEAGLRTQFFQTNHEGEFVERLHQLEGLADSVVLNPGAWTHYAWSIHDALELAGLPAAEVHLSDIAAREEWRRTSVIADLCLTTVSGRGVEGYRDAIQALARHLREKDG